MPFLKTGSGRGSVPSGGVGATLAGVAAASAPVVFIGCARLEVSRPEMPCTVATRLLGIETFVVGAMTFLPDLVNVDS